MTLPETSQQTTSGSKVRIRGIEAKKERYNNPIWRSLWTADRDTLMLILRDRRYCPLFDKPPNRTQRIVSSIFRSSRFTNHPGAIISARMIADFLGEVRVRVSPGATAAITSLDGGTFWTEDNLLTPTQIRATSIHLPMLVTVGLGYDISMLQHPDEIITYYKLVDEVLKATSSHGTETQNTDDYDAFSELQKFYSYTLARRMGEPGYICSAVVQEAQHGAIVESSNGVELLQRQVHGT